MLNKELKVVVIIPYFGDSLPEYFDLFLKTVRNNGKIMFYFFSNLDFSKNLPTNCKLFNYSLKEMEALVSLKTGSDVKLVNPYKLCDLKPFYGAIFQDYIADYDFWGISDIDLIFGNMQKFIFDSGILMKYDIISFREEWLSGVFALFRNSSEVNNLYKKSKDWQLVLSNEKHFAFDEVSKTVDQSLLIYAELRKGKSLFEIETEVESFTHILKSKKHRLKVRFLSEIKEAISEGMILKYDAKEGISVFEKGKSDFKNNDEFLNYHYISEKRTFFFSYPKWRSIPNTFFISQYGFHKNLNNLKAQILIRKFKSIIYKTPGKFFNTAFWQKKIQLLIGGK